jgi:hypothetical protein
MRSMEQTADLYSTWETKRIFYWANGQLMESGDLSTTSAE